MDTPGIREDSWIHKTVLLLPKPPAPRSDCSLQPSGALPSAGGCCCPEAGALSAGPALPSSAVGAAPCGAQPLELSHPKSSQGPQSGAGADRLPTAPAPPPTPTVLLGGRGHVPDPLWQHRPMPGLPEGTAVSPQHRCPAPRAWGHAGVTRVTAAFPAPRVDNLVAKALGGPGRSGATPMGARSCGRGREALQALVKLERGAASSRGPCPGDSDPVGRPGELRRAVTSSPTATGTEPARSRTGWIPLGSWQTTPGECWRPPCRFAARQIQLFGSELWMIPSLNKGREGLGGEANQPGDCSDPAGLRVPCGPLQHSRSAPQVLPPFGGDADQELQRAGSLLFPAAHVPAAAAP